MSSLQLSPLLLAAVFGAGLTFFAVLAVIGAAVFKRQRAVFTQRVDRQLRDLFVPVDPARLWVLQWAVATMAAILTALLAQNLVAVAAATLLALALPRVGMARLQHIGRQRLRRQIPDLLMVVAGALRAGSGLSVAFARAVTVTPAPARQHLEWLLGDLKLGTSLAAALAAFERRASCEEATLMATAVRVGAETGGPLAATLESLADAIRKRLALESRIRALTAQGRLQAWIMALLPALVLALLAMVDPPSFAEIVFTSGGRVLLLGVFAAQVIGFRLVRRIVTIEV